MFVIDKEQLVSDKRVWIGPWTEPLIEDLSQSINELSELTGCVPVQRGRVIAIRATDTGRFFSSFKAGFYHSKYNDLLNRSRFLDNIAARNQSLEVIRGETILFVYVGVSRIVYDALTMFTYGRPTRICGGSHHSLPWGIEAPMRAINPARFIAAHKSRVETVIDIYNQPDSLEQQSELECARHALPFCYLMAPFLLEFSVEALVIKVFKQRLWETGAETRETYPLLQNMWDCCCAIDEEMFTTLKVLTLADTSA